MEPDIDSKWGEWSPFHDPALLANFQARPTDVLITTAPKAGTTWMQQILFQLKTGGDTTFEDIDKVVPWLEFPRTDKSAHQQLQNYELMEEPRIFKTHCTYQQTPGVNVARIILSSRDPRDCCVSFYHHMMSLKDEALIKLKIERPGSFDDYFESWMSFSAWYRNVKSWWPHINNKNLLWLRYEDMVNNLEPCLDRILAFLNWTLDQSAKPMVLEYCSFAWMKQHSGKFFTRFDNGKSMFNSDGFIRKGQVGDHKNLLSPKQEQLILDRAKTELPEQCLIFLGLL